MQLGYQHEQYCVYPILFLTKGLVLVYSVAVYGHHLVYCYYKSPDTLQDFDIRFIYLRRTMGKWTCQGTGQMPNDVLLSFANWWPLLSTKWKIHGLDQSGRWTNITHFYSLTNQSGKWTNINHFYSLITIVHKNEHDVTKKTWLRGRDISQRTNTSSFTQHSRGRALWTFAFVVHV